MQVCSLLYKMADDDEIDVLGEFDLETLFTKEDERLMCYDGMDIPSQWLLDTSAQPCWHKPLPLYDNASVSTNYNEGDGWTSNEKDLLDRGLSLFGRSWPRLAQYVGTKTVHQVKTYVNSTSPSSFTEVGALGYAEIIDDFQIPASMEEVIAVVSTAQPTVSPLSKPKRPRPIKTKSKKVTRGRGRPPKSEVRPVKPGRPPKPPVAPPKIIVQTEEVVRMTNSCDTDLDIDIEADIEDTLDVEVECPNEHAAGIRLGTDESTAACPANQLAGDVGREEVVVATKRTKLSDQQMRLKNHHKVLDAIYSLPLPQSEIRLDPFAISDQEHEIHSEFFEGRPAKTPGRYLKIRNHIVECWRSSAPSYVSKTSVRAGLKNCGDVNCIGRIHAFLEMCGAINFGCDQTRYVRPPVGPESAPPLTLSQARAARKHKPSAAASDSDGGYTISHRADGTQTLADTVRKKRVDTDAMQLICCKKFDDTNRAGYAVELELTALITMDFHAHATHCEVIGLLGGSFNNDVLAVSRSIPCRASSSQVHCDMCPISQTQASERLQAEGYDVIGWYHSHPTFSPNPSMQDIDTQKNMQALFRERPFLGIILSPFTVASTYRCMVVQGQMPYRHNVRVVLNNRDFFLLQQQLFSIELPLSRFGEVVNERLPITYAEKCVESVSYHLGRVGNQLTSADRDRIAVMIREIATS